MRARRRTRRDPNGSEEAPAFPGSPVKSLLDSVRNSKGAMAETGDSGAKDPQTVEIAPAVENEAVRRDSRKGGGRNRASLKILQVGVGWGEVVRKLV